jgi:hypothetical protein
MQYDRMIILDCSFGLVPLLIISNRLSFSPSKLHFGHFERYLTFTARQQQKTIFKIATAKYGLEL